MIKAKRLRLLVMLFAAMALLVACSAARPEPAPQAESELAEADAPAIYANWDEVLAAAKGTTINWHMWGGSDKINRDVDSDIGQPLKEMYDITLNRVPVDDAATAVNKLLNEAAAGMTSGGSIDLLWINGENFKTLKQAGLLYGPFVEMLPNTPFVNWDDPAMANDFGTPVEGYESPWGHAQFVMEVDTAQLGAEIPTSFEALTAWIKANPGKFTYPAIPDFTGSVFLRHVFYWAAGGPEPFLGEFDQAVFDQHAPKVWEYLNDIEPHLWRGGQTYPEAAAMSDLLANKEIAFNMNYAPGNASLNIAEGIYPETLRTFVFDTGTLANNNYVAIPFNASNPAAAMVVANFIISPEYQLILADPNRWGWLMSIDPTRMSQEQQEVLAAYELGPATLSPEVLAAHALPEPGGEWVTAMEDGWIANVLEQ